MHVNCTYNITEVVFNFSYKRLHKNFAIHVSPVNLEKHLYPTHALACVSKVTST